MQREIPRVMFLMAVVVPLAVGLVYAQKRVTIQPKFTPTMEQNLEARSVPAKVTSEEESALVSKGYVKIGTISASLLGKKEDPGITKQLESAILQKAAEAGGDVVRFSKEGALEMVPTGKARKICVETSSQTVSGTPTSSTSCSTDVHGFQHCMTTNTPTTRTIVTCAKWRAEEITRNEEGLVSEGTVWLTPEMARAAEAAREAERKAEAEREEATRKAEVERAAEELRTAKAAAAEAFPMAAAAFPMAAAASFPMLGKDINTAEMKTWLSKLGTPKVDRYDDCYYYNFKSEGISLMFSSKDMLRTIFFYSEGADHFRQYQGDLPFGLSFQLTRKDIESILGLPDTSGGRGVNNYWAVYSSKGIEIQYNTKKTDDLSARIDVVGFYLTLH